MIDYYSKKNEFKVDSYLNETISGKKDFEERKLYKLVKKMKRGDTLICSELSRLSRGMFDMMAILRKCENKGIKVFSIKENITLKKDDVSRYFIPLIATFSEFERNLISLRTKEALQRLKEQGIKLGRPVGSKSKVTKLMGKEELILKMKAEKISMRKIALKLKVDEKTIRNFIKENA